jgi:phage N-6-adenine-methyltransferase
MIGQDVVLSRGWNGWPTPKDLFQALDSVFHFDIDLAACAENALCPRFFSEEENALNQDWAFLRGFLNPPYNIGKEFVNKCIAEKDEANLICLLIPARVDTKWFHSLPEGTWVFFFKGRLKFGNREKNSPAPFPSILAFFGKEAHMAKSYANKVLIGKGRWVLL